METVKNAVNVVRANVAVVLDKITDMTGITTHDMVLVLVIALIVVV